MRLITTQNVLDFQEAQDLFDISINWINVDPKISHTSKLLQRRPKSTEDWRKWLNNRREIHNRRETYLIHVRGHKEWNIEISTQTHRFWGLGIIQVMINKQSQEPDKIQRGYCWFYCRDKPHKSTSCHQTNILHFWPHQQKYDKNWAQS